MTAYYNEICGFTAQWLRNLIAAGHIAPGEVDERSIVDVHPDDLRGYTQCHFFAGIGVWSHALRLAGWSDDRPVWSGSCPCQPFSAAGKGHGYADERHLWPHWHRLTRECRPATIFGEQVAAAIRTGWLDDVSLSLESLGYAVGAVDFPACSIGAPHIRQRVYFVADRTGAGQLRAAQRENDAADRERGRRSDPADGSEDVCAVADANGDRWESSEAAPPAIGWRSAESGLGGPARAVADTAHKRRDRSGGARERGRGEFADGGESNRVAPWCAEHGVCYNANACDGNDCWLARNGKIAPPGWRYDSGDWWWDESLLGDTASGRRGIGGDASQSGSSGHADGAGELDQPPGSRRERCWTESAHGIAGQASACNGFWSNAVWLPCRDGKARPTQSWPESMADGLADRLGFVCAGEQAYLAPLVTNAKNRVGRLRGYGNAIVAPQAAEFVMVFMGCRP